MLDWIIPPVAHLSLDTRFIAAGVTSFLITLILGKPFIKRLQKKQIGQVIRDVGPQSHLSKKNTPTMGGILIIFAIVISCLAWGNLDNIPLLIGIFVLITCGLVGWLDDHLKIIRKHHEGLRGRWKLLCQGVIALLAGFVLFLVTPNGFDLAIPFVKHTYLFLGPGMIIIYWFAIVGSSNAVNLTDGQDGLVSMLIAIACCVFIPFVLYHSNINIAQTNHMLFMPGSTEMAVFAAAIAGACIAFLWFNAFPAQVFMGDVGALGLGGALAVIAISLKMELLYIIIGGIFVIEALSVMLQVGYFKATKGKRIFRMAPIHHHFELGGTPESKVTMRFWILGAVLGLIALLSLT